MKRYFSTILFIHLAFVYSWGQACFTVDADRGCAPLTVNVTTCSGSGNQVYQFESETFSATTTHTYTTPGTYTLTQKVSVGAGVDQTTRTIEVLNSPPPSFTISRCIGNEIRVNITDTNYDQFTINFGDGSALVTGALQGSSHAHTYPNGSARTVIVTGQYAPALTNCGSNSINVTPFNSLVQPDISKVTVNSISTTGSITLTYNAITGQQYEIQERVNIGSYVTVSTVNNLSGVQNITFNNRNTTFTGNVYCYRIKSIDDCGNELISSEICSINILATASNNENGVAWFPHLAGNVNYYDIIRDGASIAIQPSHNPPYQDFAIVCGTQYCYQIVANLTTTTLSGVNHQSISAPQCVTAISTNPPPAPLDFNSTITNNVPLLSWTQPASVSQYELYRSLNGASYSPYTTFTTHSFTDGNVDIPTNIYCYQLRLKDLCNNTSSFTQTTCPIILKLSIDPSNNMQNNLIWSAYLGDWPGLVQEMRVEKLDENNNVISSTPVGLSISYSDIVTGNAQLVRYRIVAIEGGTGRTTYSNIEEVRYEGSIHLPNAFSPDNDGVNDVFAAKGRFIQDYQMTIYNRWGEVVYTTDNFNEGWNGFYNGVPASVDAYAYLIVATDLWGKNITKRGSITLLR